MYQSITNVFTGCSGTVPAQHQFLALVAGVIFAVAAVAWLFYKRNARSGSADAVIAAKNGSPRKTLILCATLFVLMSVYIGIVYAMSFTLGSSTASSGPTVAVSMGDFDGDADLDYISGDADFLGDYNVEMYQNNGSGVFSAQPQIRWSKYFVRVESADFDGDGDLDLALLTDQDGVDIEIRANAGNGTFALLQDLNPNESSDIAIGDVNNDGAEDIVVAGMNQINTFINSGTGGFIKLAPVSIGFMGTRLALADFNGDGALDVALGTDTMEIFLNDGSGVFAQFDSSVVANTVSALSAGDLDGDGDMDLVVGSSGWEDVIFSNDGTGNMTLATTLSATGLQSTSFALGDLDSDGDLDITEGTTGENYIWINNGGFSFVQDSVSVEGNITRAVALGDIDADGDLDYVAGNDGQPNRHYLSDQAATDPNAAPSAPSSGFNVTLGATGNGSGTVTFDWGNGSDPETPAIMLQYHPRVGTGTGLHNIVSGISASPNYVSRLMPSGQAKTMTLNYLPCDETYYWSIKTRDTGLSLSLESDEQTFTLDGSCVLTIGGGGPPSDPVTAPDMTTGTDTGSSNSDNITKDPTPDFTGTCADGETVKLYEGVSNLVGSQLCVGSSYTITSSALGDGGKSMTSTFTNGFGESGQSPALSITIDSGVPSAPTITDPVPAESVGSSPTVAGVCEAGSTVSIANAALAVNPTTTPCGGGAYSTSVSFTSGGAQTLSVTQTDTAGNISGAATVNVTVTMSVPPAPVIAPDLTTATDTGVSGTDNITMDTTPDFTGTCTTGETVKLYRAGVTLIGSQICSGGVYTITSAALAHATHTITSSFTNIVGESGPSPGLAVTVDTGTPADPTVSSPPSGTTVQSSVTVQGTCEAGSTVSVANGALAANPSEDVCTGGGTYSILVVFTAAGAQNLIISAHDVAGNNSASVAVTVIVEGLGGGWPWNVIRQHSAPPPPSPPPATLSLSAFQDLNGNTIRDDNEAGDPFVNLLVTVRGITADGTDLLETVMLDASGNASLALAPSSSFGYTVTVDTGSSVLTGFKATTPTTMNVIKPASAETRAVSFGFRPRNLLGYRPCLTIEGIPDSNRTSDSEALLTALRDSFSLPVLRGITLASPLISRGDFFTILQRTQCITLNDIPLDEGSFVDLEPAAPAAPILAALMRRGFPVARSTSRGSAADLSAPLTRREALLLLAAALNPPSPSDNTVAVLPSDLTPENALSPTFLRLADLGILPPSFTSTLSPGRGLTPQEAITLLVRASFVSGKIPVTASDWEDEPLHAAAPSAPAFLSLLPTLPAHSCLQKDPGRSQQIRFTDLLPGDPLFGDIARLLTIGTLNADGRTLWLLPATRHLAEFGVPSADVPLKPDDPVTIDETIRSLLVLSCLPIDTAEEVRNGTPRLTGTPESRVARDRLTDLPRNPTLSSRILYRSQDHQRAYDLSLFTYASDLLLGETKKAQGSFSVSEASNLFSSALLAVAVRDGLITPQEAELKVEPLRLGILASLLGKDSLTWRDGEPGNTAPLTRRMLMEFLSAATINEDSSSTDMPVPLGKLWWERVK